MSSGISGTSSQTDSMEYIIEQLRCFICKGYLSSSPLRVLSDGHSICGRCTPPTTDAAVYRTITLESALNNFRFPCRFAKYGCTNRSLFGYVIEHEDTCGYKTFACLASSLCNCTWEGPIFEILEHFLKTHDKRFKQKDEFKINVDKDIEQNLWISEKENVVIVIRYSYNAEKKQLKYFIRYLSLNSLQVFYAVKIYNEADRNSYFSLKQNLCEYYQPDALTLKDETVLNMKPYMEILGNPKVILFSTNVKVVDDENSGLNYELLATLKCTICGIYVTPPIFKKLNGELTCANCGEKNRKCSLSEDKELHKIMVQINYPCRWQECKIIKKIDDIRKHELDCMYRVFDCPVNGCNKTYSRGEAVDHFEEWHDRTYFYRTFGCGFETPYHELKCEYQLFALKNGEAILIDCAYDRYKFTYTVVPLSMAQYVTVTFKLLNCPNTTKKFCTSETIEITDFMNYCYQARTPQKYMATFTVK